jgi:predicted nucleic acid-binding protein
VIDTSVLVAGLVANHEFHARARPYVVEATGVQVPGIVLAETWSVLRRAPFHLDAGVVADALAPWASPARVAETPAGAYVEVLRIGRVLHLGGNVHDLLIAHTCAAAGGRMATLDRQQAALARDIPGLEVALLLPEPS